MNKYQKAWVEKLESGTTKKAVGTLKEGSHMCCLGVACNVLKGNLSEQQIFDFKNIDCLEDRLSGVRDMLKLSGPEAEIDINKVSKKWKEILVKKYKVDLSNKLFLTVLNDGVQGSSKINRMSHKMIGKFIRENQSAVFVK